MANTILLGRSSTNYISTLLKKSYSLKILTQVSGRPKKRPAIIGFIFMNVTELKLFFEKITASLKTRYNINIEILNRKNILVSAVVFKHKDEILISDDVTFQYNCIGIKSTTMA